MVLTAGSMFWGCHTLVPVINSVFLQEVWVPLTAETGGIAKILSWWCTNQMSRYGDMEY